MPTGLWMISMSFGARVEVALFEGVGRIALPSVVTKSAIGTPSAPSCMMR